MAEKKDVKWKIENSPSFLSSEGKVQIWAGIFPVHWCLPVIFFVMGFLHLGALIKTALLTFDELLILIECANFIMILASASVIAVIFSVPTCNRKMKLAYRKLDEGFQSYGDTLDNETLTEIQSIIMESTKKRTASTFILKYLIFSVFFMVGVLRPIYKYFNGELAENNYSKFINRNLPIIAWLPYNTKEWPGFIFILITEYYLMFNIIFMMAGVSAQFIIFAETVTCELSILQLTLGNLIRRANHVAQLKGKAEVTKEILEICIGKSISHHQNIILFFDLFQTSWTWLIWTASSVAAFMICFNGFVCTNGEVELIAKAISFVSFIVMIIMLFLLCIYGETIQSLGSEIGLIIYNSDWLPYSLMLKQYILMLETIALKPLILYGGGLIEMNLNTFGNILSTSYTYFNLLRASRQE